MMQLKITVVLLFALFHTGDVEIITKPKDTEAVIGSLAYFNCSSSISTDIQWFFYSGKGDQDRSIVFGYNEVYVPFKGRFHVEKNETTASCNIVIESITVTDVGKYECQDDAGRGAKSSAQLIVLDSQPHCHSNIDTDKVIGPNNCGIKPSLLILSCIASFHGNEAPIMQWTKDGDPGYTGTVKHEIRGNQAIYNLSMRGEPSLNGSSYSCSTKRSITTKNFCKSGAIQIIGATSDTHSTACGQCPPASNCIIGLVIVICLFIIIILPATVVLDRYCLHRQYKQLGDSRKDKAETIFYYEVEILRGFFVRTRQQSPNKNTDEDVGLLPRSPESNEKNDKMQRKENLRISLMQKKEQQPNN